MTIRSDLSQLDHAYRAKRSAMTRAEYANAIYGYRAPASWKTRGLWLAALGLLVGAIYFSAR